MEDIKGRLIECYQRCAATKSHHIDLPNMVFEKLKARKEFEAHDVFGCNERFDWIKDENLIKGNTLVDLAGSTGFFSQRAILEGVISSSTVVDINSDALEIGKLASKILGISNEIRYELQSLEIGELKQLPSADVVFCLNFLHHAGIEFDKSIVAEIGWENYAHEFLDQLRRKYKQIVISLAFKGINKPKGLNIPFHQFEQYIANQVLKKAGWQCLATANVGRLNTNSKILQNSIGYNIKFLGLDLIWILTKRWSFTKKMAEVTNISVPGKLGRYFIFIAE